MILMRASTERSSKPQVGLPNLANDAHAGDEAQPANGGGNCPWTRVRGRRVHQSAALMLSSTIIRS